MPRNDTRAESLKAIYGDNCERYTDIDYRHPVEKRLLIELKAILSECDTGKHLIEVSNELKLNIYLIKHNRVRGNALGGKILMLSLPENKTKVEPIMVLELAAALREAEQTHLGFEVPGKDTTPLEFAAMNHAKNLDVVVHMCKVAAELSQSPNKTGYADALEEQGLGGIYDAYVRDFSSDEIVDTYYTQA